MLLTLANSLLADAPAPQRERMMKHWQEKRVRTFFTLLTAIIGIVLLLDLTVQIYLVFSLTTAQFLAIAPFVRYGLFVIVAVGLPIRYSMRGNRSSSSASTP